MPSGDAAQAAMFSQFLLNNFTKSFFMMGGPIGSAQMVLCVCFARVYFHCHYLGDTMVGVLVGVLLGNTLHNSGLKQLLKTILGSVLISSSDDIYYDEGEF